MPTANERKALWFLALLAMSGSAVRLWRIGSNDLTAADNVGLSAQLRRVDSARARHERPKPDDSGPRQLPPVADVRRSDVDAPALVDLDRATAAEIDALPGIGPALAGRIVGDRDSAGTFGAIEALCSVRGVGPALAARLRPLVTFSGAPRPVSDGCGDASRKARKTRGQQSRKPR